ncbi:MAG: non-ribosomal peptide synthetase, partial [Bryobacterales bacterium]|nr:non-ribosomal peptide synthetase [Bryobacterales bacterium]
WLRGETLDKHVEYWRQTLSGAPPVLELPTDRPRPAVPSHRGGAHRRDIPDDLLRAILALAQAEGVTLFMTLLGAFQALLSLYSGQTDIVVGTQSAGRADPALESLIGFFVNAMVLRVDLSGDPGFREILRRVRTAALSAYAHQDVPFEKLVEELNPERSLSYHPIFQVSMIQDQVIDALQFPGLNVEETPFHPGTSISDITCCVIETLDGARLFVEYDSDLFDAGTIERMFEHLCVLLEAVTRDPGLHLSSISLLTPDEKHRLLVEFNGTTRPYPRERSLHQFIEDQVERTPEAPALVFESRELTYSELNSRANQLAHRLRGLGVGPDVLVAVCAERSLEIVVALLGIIKAGGAYVPFDPEYPRERLSVMLGDAQPAVVLTLERLLDVLPQHDYQVFCLDRDWPSLSNESAANPPVLTGGKDLAYVIYTSGSTGKPKGVPNVHEAIVNRLLWMQATYPLNGTDRVLQKTPYSFDVSVWEFFWPLMTGACLVVARPGSHKDPDYLVKLIAESNITTVHFVPSMLRIFLESAGVERCTSLRRVICSGEALPFELQERFFERLGAELHNLYGPTEAAVDVTYWHCRSNSGRAMVPIGKPIWNTQIYILDAHRQLAPIGVPGELHIGGVGLARGYLKRPELTAEKFIHDPFSQEPGARVYKTGDLARFLPDGNIEYLGRIDFQIKLRGFRIELGEIEAVLAQHPAVSECVVIAREDVPGDKRLVGYVVPSANQSTRASELGTWVKQKLPEYMTPAVFVELERFPLTSNGKVDRRNLPEPEYRRLETAGAFAGPRTPAEEMIAGIWAEVLKLDRVGVADNFFELGGHSLSATQVVARARAAFGIEVPLRVLFEAPTLRALAESIHQLERASHGSVPPSLLRANRDGALPLSFTQQRLWFLYQMEPESSLYNVPWAARMTGLVNAEALETALNAIVQRHEILRTTYGTENDLPVQIVRTAAHIPLERRDLSLLPAAGREQEARRILQEEYAKPFNLASDIVFRPMLLKLEERDHVIFVKTHHIANDGWSTGVMLSDLGVFYEAALAGVTPMLPELPIQYADFAVWQRNWLRGEVLERQVAYWKNQLDGAPPVLLLPTDRPRPAVQGFRGATERTQISKALADQIGLLSRQEGVTTFITMLAAFQCLILYYTKQPDVVLGTDFAGRTNVETEALIGFFVNLMVVRTDLSRDPSFSELLVRVREVILGAHAHQDVPFDKLVEELQPERSLSRNPLVQVLFVHLNTPGNSRPLPDIELSGFPLEGPSKFDLAVFCRGGETGIAGAWVYNPDLFTAATIARMAGHYQTILQNIIANPGVRLSEILQALEVNEQERRTTEHKEFQAASLQKLKGIRRR